MTCDQFRDHLENHSSSFQTLQHLLTCPQCRASQGAVNRQHRLARKLSGPELPLALKARVFDQLPVTQVPSTSRKRPIMKIVLSAAVSFAVLGGIWTAQPRSVTTPAFASEVRSAIQHANTWQFQGWRIVGGQKVRWEIWGRRQPFFYREQVGDDILIDNGKSRLRLLPPDNFQKKGYAVSLPSQPLHAVQEPYGNGPQEQFIEGIAGDFLDNLDQRSHDANQFVLVDEYDYGLDHDKASLTVDAHSHLPVLYHLDRATIPSLPSGEFGDRHGPSRPTAELSMKYDVAIPVALATVSIPITYQTVAATGGLVLQPHVLGRDTHGRLHIRIDQWLAGKPLGTGKIFPWFQSEADLECSPYSKPGEAQFPTDESGRRYRPERGTTNHGSPNYPGYSDFWLTPIDPVAPHSAAAPRMLRIPVVAILTFDKGVPDRYMTAVWTQIPILRTKSTLSIPLP